MVRVLSLTLGALVVLGLLAEVIAPRLVATRVAATVEDRTGGAVAVDAAVAGRPFLPQLLLGGRVDGVTVTVEEVAGAELAATTLTLGVEDVVLERDALWRGEATVTAIARGTLEVVVDTGLADLPVALPEPLEAAAVRTRDGVVEVAGTRVAVSPVGPELLPCSPEVAGVDGRRVELRCGFSEAPQLLIAASDAAQGRAPQ